MENRGPLSAPDGVKAEGERAADSVDVFAEIAVGHAAFKVAGDSWRIRDRSSCGTAARVCTDGRWFHAAVGALGPDATRQALSHAIGRVTHATSHGPGQEYGGDSALLELATPEAVAVVAVPSDPWVQELEDFVEALRPKTELVVWHHDAAVQSISVSVAAAGTCRQGRDVRCRWGLSLDQYFALPRGGLVRWERHLSGTARPLATDCASFCATVSQLACEGADARYARRVAAGEPYDVVLAAGCAGILFHEAFGHLVEEPATGAAGWTVGQRLGPTFLSIADDATRPGLFGTQMCDDLGARSAPIELLREGVVVDVLRLRPHGDSPQASARRADFRCPPHSRLTNLVVHPGTSQVEDIVGDLRRGLYVTTIAEASVDHPSSCVTLLVSEARLIERGRIGPVLEPFAIETLASDLLRSVRALGPDVRPRSFYCQSRGIALPESVSAPTCLLSGLRPRFLSADEYIATLAVPDADAA